MPTIIKTLVLLGGATGTLAGLFMLLFMDKFVAFNNYVNTNFFGDSRNDSNNIKFDSWVFGQSYLIAVVLLIVGLALLTQFTRYAAY
ncbi:MAG: hypothetical protein PHH14_00790 [Candidatus Margulisbacteria bacterium]|nr:hypothetical protein [Candidatus Margulisiibacteriota bacterium]